MKKKNNFKSEIEMEKLLVASSLHLPYECVILLHKPFKIAHKIQLSMPCRICNELFKQNIGHTTKIDVFCLKMDNIQRCRHLNLNQPNSIIIEVFLCVLESYEAIYRIEMK